jgi:hypothetical protein
MIYNDLANICSLNLGYYKKIILGIYTILFFSITAKPTEFLLYFFNKFFLCVSTV